MSYNCQHWECYRENYCVRGRRVGWGRILFHTFMIFITAGLWIIPLVVGALLRRRR